MKTIVQVTVFVLLPSFWSHKHSESLLERGRLFYRVSEAPPCAGLPRSAHTGQPAPLTCPLPTALPPTAPELQHLQRPDARPLQDIHLHSQPPHQLLGAHADSVLVLPKPPLQELFVTEEEDSLVLAGNQRRGSERLSPLLPGRREEGTRVGESQATQTTAKVSQGETLPRKP